MIALLDMDDAQLQAFIDQWMTTDMGDPVLQQIKELMLEVALRLRQVRVLAKAEWTEFNGHRWVRADEVMALLS